MRSSINQSEVFSEAFKQEKSGVRHHDLSISVSNIESGNDELENEIKKQNPPFEKGAKTMQLIWGDKFLSDSLH